MKKLLTIAVCASAVAAFATDTEIPLGTLGVTSVSVTATNTVIVSSYLDLGGSETVPVSNIVKTTNLEVGDKLYVFKSSNVYEAYTLAQDGGAKYWDADKLYTVNSDGSLNAGVSAAPTIPTLSIGSGLWLVRPRENPSVTIQVYGGLPAATNFNVTAGSTVLVGNPTRTAMAPSEIENAVDGDQILVPGNSQMPTIYSYGTGMAGTKCWYRRQSGNKVDGLPAIAAGNGFWYIAKGSGSARVVKW